MAGLPCSARIWNLSDESHREEFVDPPLSRLDKGEVIEEHGI
jgi:hypothetical protein